MRILYEIVSDRKNRSWFERCTPCCRRWRRTRYDDYQPFSPQRQRYRFPSDIEWKDIQFILVIHPFHHHLQYHHHGI